MRYSKVKKIRNFVGRTNQSLEPVFLNSMPKSGTNLVEHFFIAQGYKRNYAMSYNEHNVPAKRIPSRRGRLDVGHLFDDEICHTNGHRTVFLMRPLWKCINSYLNYMLIDRSHSVSEFIRVSIAEKNLQSSIERLIFSSQNPLGRSLISEYERFFRIDLNRYDLVLNYDDFKSKSAGTISKVAGFLSVPTDEVCKNIHASLISDTWTKNQGKVDIFDGIQPSFLREVRTKVELIDEFSVYFT